MIKNFINILIVSWISFSLINCEENKSQSKKSKQFTVILDTDANNELDDQHAIAYLLFNQKIFKVKGITVNKTYSGKELKHHVAEAQRIVTLCGFKNKIKVIPGASGRYEDIVKTIHKEDFDGNQAVNFIIKNASEIKNEKLIVLSIGKLTNIALALKKAPEIANKIKVIWLGSNWPKPGEYNLENDPSSINKILKNPRVELEIVTVRYGENNGTDAVSVSVEEMKRKMKGMGPKIAKPIIGRHGGEFDRFGDYSIELFVKYRHPTRPLFDLCVLSILKNPDLGHMKIAYKVSFDGKNWGYNGDENRQVVFWEKFNKEGILKDFFETMRASENLINN